MTSHSLGAHTEERSNDSNPSECKQPPRLSSMPESEAIAILKRTLSPSSTPTPMSSSADIMAIGHGTDLFFLIGMGTCGTVFEIAGTQQVIKVGGTNNIKGLWRDFLLTSRAHESIMRSSDVLGKKYPGLKVPFVPAVYEFHRHDDTDFWRTVISRFPMDIRDQPAYIMERIPSVPEVTRRALIRKFFPVTLQDKARSDPRNETCLIRPYFGENTPEDWIPEDLWNFPLYLDVISALGLDSQLLVKEMALGLAVLHWISNVEASDVEFVLGASNITHALPHYNSDPVNVHRYDARRCTHLYILDFDKSRSFSLAESSEDIIRKLVVGVQGNDPYYPKPHLDAGLWRVFKEVYLGASALLLRGKLRREGVRGEGVLGLPGEFMEAWERKMRDNEVFDRMVDFFEGGEDERHGEDEGWGSDDLEEEEEEEEEDDDDNE